MRSAELERIKREAGKPTFESDSERQIRFAKVKGNFEKIQKLQDTIVKLYTRSKKIDYLKISETATQLVKNAIHLEENLFGENFANIEKKEISKKSKAKNIPDLIVALDNAIGLFVVSPIFQNRQTVDSEESEKAEETLREIIRLSGELSKESAKLK